MGNGAQKMITYKLEYCNEKELKYTYYPWKDTEDVGFIIASRKGNVLQYKMTKADSPYPGYFNEMLPIACRNAESENPEKEGSMCWL